MEKTPQSRRSFLTSLTLLLASGGLLVRYLMPRSAGNRRVLASAAAADVPLGGALLFRSERIILLRKDTGFYALSLICTHLGCTVTVTENGLACPCHGSLFDRQGKVLKGPADRALIQLPVEEHGERIDVLG
ncbi:MAG TPA: Rieske (2Fe-2S) protein [Desulfuromonadales bacterium]|nr:Rieske (2Fe-2S) protein [Desulfuromonadales bacterium]